MGQEKDVHKKNRRSLILQVVKESNMPVGLNIKQFKDLVIDPALFKLDREIIWSDSAVNLLLGTAIQESRLVYLKQLDTGPALGVYQMEPRTHDDIWENFLAYRDDLSSRIEKSFRIRNSEALIWDMGYATAMARVHYYRVPEALPDATDISKLATYWKRHYNTVEGKGTPLEFIEKYSVYAAGI